MGLAHKHMLPWLNSTVFKGCLVMYISYCYYLLNKYSSVSSIVANIRFGLEV